MRALIAALALVAAGCPAQTPVQLAGASAGAAASDSTGKESKVVPLTGTATAHGKAR